ncbi:serine hydrolase domain-containing protein [Phytohabitans sp. ZYX-F-186]|uniref:Serine hydrolase domain-containing protein n=1 Tax=Phytohabitans maris TaxID=3071409 RepID=A0ABU0ZVM7_9ACTN|nr:serine hydrolase domain-containing protein [Phytohabitans sp. ZYX-F-186]MDQ7909997.1 serine hydrolase domain-containing protein [Phytohabitans sp. ZYX-F-186]
MLTLGVATQAVADDTDKVRLGDVDRALAELVKGDKVVGAIGAAYVDDRKVDKGSAGSRLIGGKGGRIPTNALFRIGSQTKLMTQVAIMKLVSEGKISLDDRLSDLLPVVVEQELVDYADQITVQQMIHHTSGIPNWYDPKLVDIFDFTTYQSPIELVALTKDVEPTGLPGESYSYSNSNYMLLGLIIEKFKRSVAAAFEEYIFEPLDMDRTYLPVEFPGGIKGPHGHGYHPDENGEMVDVDQLNMSYGYAAGGVISNTDDLSAFHQGMAGDLLTKEEKDALNAGRPRPGPPPSGAPEPSAPPAGPGVGVCGGQYQLVKGGSPGFSAVSFNNQDGSVQFVVSVTRAADQDEPEIDEAITKAAEAVLCPKR